MKEIMLSAEQKKKDCGTDEKTATPTAVQNLGGNRIVYCFCLLASRSNDPIAVS